MKLKEKLEFAKGMCLSNEGAIKALAETKRQIDVQIKGLQESHVMWRKEYDVCLLLSKACFYYSAKDEDTFKDGERISIMKNQNVC